MSWRRQIGRVGRWSFSAWEVAGLRPGTHLPRSSVRGCRSSFPSRRLCRDGVRLEGVWCRATLMAEFASGRKAVRWSRWQEAPGEAVRRNSITDSEWLAPPGCRFGVRTDDIVGRWMCFGSHRPCRTARTLRGPVGNFPFNGRNRWCERGPVGSRRRVNDGSEDPAGTIAGDAPAAIC